MRGTMLRSPREEIRPAPSGSGLTLATMTTMPDPTPSHPRLEHLAHDIDRFRAFVRKRVPDRQRADDVLQDAFARAARAIDQVEDPERLDAWFYRILRNRIADLGTQSSTSKPLTAEPTVTPADLTEICHCMMPLVERLAPDQAEALREVDLAGLTSDAVAERLGISTNALNVRRHRGRQHLRSLLDAACGMCATEGCRDCRCS